MKLNAKNCVCCGSAKNKCIPRDFSTQAWELLTSWGEINQKDAKEPICEACYWELREVLIDRASEVEAAFTGATPKGPVTPLKRKLA